MEFIGEHSSSDTAGSLWERCARRLPLNNPENLADLQQILNSILTKCLNNPDDPKYFNLKLESKLLQSRVVSREGGLDFLLATGFKSVVKDDEKFLSLLSPNMDDIESAIAWLQDTANTCYSMAASHRNSSKSCCECILQIRLPTAMVVAGGFMKNDKLKDLLSFVRCFFNPDRHDAITLRLPHLTTSIINPNNLESTLESAGLHPRSIVVASVVADFALPEAMKKVNEKVTFDKKAAAEKAAKLRQSKVAASNQRLEERRKILDSFKDDRLDQNYRRNLVMTGGVGEDGGEGAGGRQVDGTTEWGDELAGVNHAGAADQAEIAPSGHKGDDANDDSEVEEEFGGASFEGNVEALVAMGFAKDAVEGTLRAVGNNMQVATESLLSSSSSS